MDIVPYSDPYRNQILNVWEESVTATHHFLTPIDFQAIRNYVRTIDFSRLNVFCMMDGDIMAGFIGIAAHKVEMLFIAPRYFRQGLGKRLMMLAVSEWKIERVDVNEQNESAVEFYRCLGFETVERSEYDDQGHHYPILRMKLGNRFGNG